MALKIKTRKLKVGPHLYTVQWLTGEQFDKAHSDWKPDSTIGACHPSLLRIDIRLDIDEAPIPQTKLQETLLHEILHAVWEQTKLAGGDTEEAGVLPLGAALLDTLWRNPWVLEKLKPAA